MKLAHAQAVEPEDEGLAHGGGARLRERLADARRRVRLRKPVDLQPQPRVAAQQRSDLVDLRQGRAVLVDGVRCEWEENMWEAWWVLTQVEALQGPLDGVAKG